MILIGQSGTGSLREKSDVVMYIVSWCNGSTTEFGSVSWSSSLCETTFNIDNMEAKFKIGDKVIITTLDSQYGKRKMDGTIGHIGIIESVFLGASDSSVHWYRLVPTTVGNCWPEDCLELVELEYPSVEELRKNSNIEFV